MTFFEALATDATICALIAILYAVAWLSSVVVAWLVVRRWPS